MAPSPRPVNTAFGIRVDSRDVGISFPNAADAAAAAGGLSAHGYKKIEIFDRLSGRIVNHVSPNPASA